MPCDAVHDAETSRTGQRPTYHATEIFAAPCCTAVQPVNAVCTGPTVRCPISTPHSYNGLSSLNSSPDLSAYDNKITQPHQQRRPHVGAPLPETYIASHLSFQQPRTVVERCGQPRVLRAQNLLLDRLAPLVEWGSLVVLALLCSRQRERVVSPSRPNLQ